MDYYYPSELTGSHSMDSLLKMVLQKCRSQKEKDKAVEVYRLGVVIGAIASFAVCGVISFFTK